MTISHIVWSWLLLVPLIPSVIVAIFDLYHLLMDRALRTALNNHMIILLLPCGLIVCLTDIVPYIYYFRNGTSMVQTPAFCTAWTMADSAPYVSFSMLMAWGSIERHILIFHSNWFRSKKKCFFLHYLPFGVCLLYPAIFYIVTLIIIPCDISFDYNYSGCYRYACIVRIRWVSRWDSIVNYITPAFTTAIFSIILFVRVLYKRYRAQGRIDWRNYRKLTLQVLPISILYIALQLPPMIMYAAYTAGLNWDVGAGYDGDALTFTYWVILFSPFACVVSLPELKTKCRKVIFFWRRRQAVGLEILEMAPRNVGRQTLSTRRNVGQPLSTRRNVGQTLSTRRNVGQPLSTRRNVGQTLSTRRNVGQTPLVVETIL